MISYEEIKQRINQFLIEDFEVESETISPNASLKDTLDLDSLDYIDLIVAIEKSFGIKVKPEEFQDMHTMKDFYNFINHRLNSKINT